MGCCTKINKVKKILLMSKVYINPYIVNISSRLLDSEESFEDKICLSELTERVEFIGFY